MHMIGAPQLCPSLVLCSNPAEEETFETAAISGDSCLCIAHRPHVHMEGAGAQLFAAWLPIAAACVGRFELFRFSKSD